MKEKGQGKKLRTAKLTLIELATGASQIPVDDARTSCKIAILFQMIYWKLVSVSRSRTFPQVTMHKDEISCQR